MNQVIWIVESRVILAQPRGDQTLQDIEDMNEQMMTMIMEGSPPVHVISDVRYMGKYPTSLKTLTNLFQLNANVGAMALIGGNTLTKFTTKMLKSLLRWGDMAFFDDIQEGVSYLQSIDTNLPKSIDYDETP